MRVIRPREELSPYVRYYWMCESDEPFSFLTFPIGCPQIIFHRKAPLFIPEIGTLQSKFTISGQVNFPAHIESSGHLDMVVAVFYPHAIGMFIETPPSCFYNHEISGYDLENKALTEMANRIFDCKERKECIEILEKWLLSRLRPTLDMERIQSSLIQMMNSSIVQVNDLASLACLGKRQFERVFRETVGMNPKEYHRVVRFQKAIWLMQQGEEDGIAISTDCGFSDQSHFIREFKALSGLTPSSFRKTCAPYSDLFTHPV